jgi:hypothetical protein
MDVLYGVLTQTWKDAAIGSERVRDPLGRVDSQGYALMVPKDPIPPYAPDAIIRAGILDPGLRIPRRALTSEKAFVAWATENGFSTGASIEIEGLLAAPGRPIVSAIERKRTWIPVKLRKQEKPK